MEAKLFRDAYIPLILAGSLAGASLKFFVPIPNIELLLPFVMAAGILSGPGRGFMAGFSIRMIYDFYLGMPGPWTVYTTLAYGLVGLLASFIPIGASRARHLAWAAGLTLIYDIITMAGFGLSFGLPLLLLIGPQMPFTALHLAGNCVFVFAILPGTLKYAKKLSSGELLRLPFLSGAGE